MTSHATSFNCLEPGQSKHFFSRLDAHGFEYTFDILSRSTRQLLFSLPVWNDLPAARFDTLLLMAALDRFVDRGGSISPDELKSALAAQGETPAGSEAINHPLAKGDT